MSATTMTGGESRHTAAKPPASTVHTAAQRAGVRTWTRTGRSAYQPVTATATASEQSTTGARTTGPSALSTGSITTNASADHTGVSAPTTVVAAVESHAAAIASGGTAAIIAVTRIPRSHGPLTTTPPTADSTRATDATTCSVTALPTAGAYAIARVGVIATAVVAVATCDAAPRPRRRSSPYAARPSRYVMALATMVCRAPSCVSNARMSECANVSPTAALIAVSCASATSPAAYQTADRSPE